MQEGRKQNSPPLSPRNMPKNRSERRGLEGPSSTRILSPIPHSYIYPSHVPPHPFFSPPAHPFACIKLTEEREEKYIPDNRFGLVWEQHTRSLARVLFEGRRRRRETKWGREDVVYKRALFCFASAQQIKAFLPLPVFQSFFLSRPSACPPSVAPPPSSSSSSSSVQHLAKAVLRSDRRHKTASRDRFRRGKKKHEKKEPKELCVYSKSGGGEDSFQSRNESRTRIVPPSIFQEPPTPTLSTLDPLLTNEVTFSSLRQSQQAACLILTVAVGSSNRLACIQCPGWVDSRTKKAG